VIFAWVLRVDTVLSLGTALLLLVTLVFWRPVLPALVYKLAAGADFLGWAAFFLLSGDFLIPRSMMTNLWVVWVPMVPFILPLEAVILGWLGMCKPQRG
jgi:hypothetical protein